MLFQFLMYVISLLYLYFCMLCTGNLRVIVSKNYLFCPIVSQLLETHFVAFLDGIDILRGCSNINVAIAMGGSMRAFLFFNSVRVGPESRNPNPNIHTANSRLLDCL